jgi:hypothetical protein
MLVVIAGSFGAKAQSDDKPAPTAAPANQAPRQRPSVDDRAKQATERLHSTVQLTPEQYAKVLAINKDFFTQREAQRTSPNGGADMKASARGLAKDREDKIKAVLTPEQIKKQEEARATQQQNGHMAGHE